MAEIFVKELGAALITGPLPECSDPDRNCYPSPEQLKHRIIIKAKKLEHGRSDVACSSNADTEDISLAVLTGYGDGPCLLSFASCRRVAAEFYWVPRELV
jgi:hypothetical protein